MFIVGKLRAQFGVENRNSDGSSSRFIRITVASSENQAAIVIASATS